ncbi:hypothetical protein GAN23_09655 [Bacteroides thetaiotaomicron]|nr:hypothetical protein GAN23_09655 [Bacteroides thetaiotaomicron]
MDRNSEEYQQMRDKALSQLRSGESLTGKDGAFGPLLLADRDLERYKRTHRNLFCEETKYMPKEGVI